MESKVQTGVEKEKNRVGSGPTSETGHVFVAKTPETFIYDNDGNLLKDGRFNYTWDCENRLISAETLTNLPASVPRVRVEFEYDYMSRRISKTVGRRTGGGLWQLMGETSFLYDGWNVVSEICDDQSQITTNFYVWGLDLSGSLQGAGGIGGLLAAQLGTNSVFYTYDGNGNVSELINTLDGTIAAHYEYSPFGETIVADGLLAQENKFRFSTKYFVDEIGMGDWGYRWYFPSIGRWLSRDPIGEQGGLNQYAYVNNESVGRWDILGLAGKTCDGDLSCIKDCKWTGSRNANRITGDFWDWWRHQAGKYIPGVSESPPMQANWDNVCSAGEWIEKVKTLSKPTPGSGNIGISGSGGIMNVESRWWVPRPIGYGGDDAGAMSASSGDFCCCKILAFY